MNKDGFIDSNHKYPSRTLFALRYCWDTERLQLFTRQRCTLQQFQTIHDFPNTLCCSTFPCHSLVMPSACRDLSFLVHVWEITWLTTLSLSFPSRVDHTLSVLTILRRNRNFSIMLAHLLIKCLYFSMETLHTLHPFSGWVHPCPWLQ